MHRRQIVTVACAALYSFAIACCPTDVSAQRVGSWVDIAGGNVGAGVNANGEFQSAKSKSSSSNGIDFGHGFTHDAGPDGIALSNSLGIGRAGKPGGPLRGGSYASGYGQNTKADSKSQTQNWNTQSYQLQPNYQSHAAYGPAYSVNMQSQHGSNGTRVIRSRGLRIMGQ